MSISDQDFVVLASGIATASGVFLAALVAIALHIFQRITNEEVNAPNRVRSSAERVYILLNTHGSQNNIGRSLTYFSTISIDLQLSFLGLITRLSSLHSDEDIPGYIEWRSQTDFIRQHVADYNSNQMISGKNTIVDDFHVDFTYAMTELDNAIQMAFAALRPLRDIQRKLLFVSGIVASLILFSVTAMLGASTKFKSGIPDNINIYVAIVMLVELISAASLTVTIIDALAKPSKQWVERAIEQHRKNLAA